MSTKKNFLKTIRHLVKESLEEIRTEYKDSLTSMIEELQDSISHEVVLDDSGNYIICECEPHHISIRPIVYDVFDCLYIKDGTDREKKLGIKFDELKEYIKEKLKSKDLNYVDNARKKVEDNSKDKEGKDNTDHVVNYKNKKVDLDNADDLNKKEDNPDEKMKEVGEFKKSIDYKEKKPTYTPPKLPNNLHNLVIKMKNKRGRPRK